MAHTDTWDASFDANPADSQARALGATRIRETRLGVHERLVLDHYWAGTAHDGRHKAGSAMAYYQASVPTVHPDGVTALADDAYSKGRLFIDSDTDILYYWRGAAFAHVVVAQLYFKTWIGGITEDLEAWSSSYAVLEFPGTAIMGQAASAPYDSLSLLSNAYYDGAWKRKAEGYAAYMSVHAGDTTLGFSSAATSTINSAITWVGDFSLVGSAGGSGACSLKLGGAAGGSNRDSYLYFATDAYLFWDESESRLDVTCAARMTSTTLFVGLATHSGGLLLNSYLQMANLTGSSTGTSVVWASDEKFYYASSSLRYKKDVRTVDLADVDLLKAVRAIAFKEKSSDASTEFYGFAAEEVLDLSEGFGARRLIDGEMKPDSVHYEKFVPLLTAGWQDHERRLLALETVHGQ
jgi:hypothetical protein